MKISFTVLSDGSCQIDREVGVLELPAVLNLAESMVQVAAEIFALARAQLEAMT